MRVLIVDDEPMNLGVLVAALKHEHEILTANDGYQALEQVKTHSPDLVLLDVMMPELDGLQVARLLRAEPALADTSIMFVTALDSTEGQREGLELGAVDYITKPIDLHLVRLRVRNHLELKRQRKLVEEQNVRLTQQKAELEAALERVRKLEGIIGICMYCKKVRHEGVWEHLEKYIGERTDARISHGVCPSCLAERYGEEE